MLINDHQRWLRDFYRSKHWYELSPEWRMNFITEEEGELARAVRAIEIGRSHPGEKTATTAEKEYNLREEMADIIDQVLILADKYGVSGEELLQFSEDKLKKRWHLE